jgi:uncharacterized membrane protein
LRRLLSLASLVIITMLWSAALVAAPSATNPRLSAATYAAGSLICHQRPERSFYRGSAQYPVCARCLGLYAGAVAGVLAWCGIAGFERTPRARAARIVANGSLRRVLIVTAIPSLATVALAWVGGWDSSNVTRAALALPLGGAIALVVAAVAAGDLR